MFLNCFRGNMFPHCVLFEGITLYELKFSVLLIH